MSRLARTLIAVGVMPLAMLSIPRSATATSPAVVNSCDQNVAPGHYTCFAEHLTAPATRIGARFNAAVTPQGYGPADLSSAYGFRTAPAGTGRRVFIIDAFDDAHAASDMAAYRRHYRLPPCTTANGCFKKVNQAGATSPLPKVDTGWAGETSLDLDVVSAICPACGITLVEATDAGDNLLVATKEAAKLGGRYVSMSWGGPDNSDDTTFDRNDLKSSGVFYSVATGDFGYSGGVTYPATSPYVVAAGGTSLTRSATPRGWTETAWSGAQSGCTANEAEPSWQVSANTGCNGRANADFSANADPQTGDAVYNTYDGGWEVVGGTSAAAPLIAAMAARAGVSGNSDAYAYAHPNAFNDVTSGSNSALCLGNVLCQAGVGWDGPTGLGSPIGLSGFGNSSSAQAASCVGNLVTNPGFESRAAGWSLTGGAVRTSAALAHTGSKYTLLDGTGHTRTDRLARSIKIPTGCNATLSYWVRVTSSDHTRTAHDKLQIRVNGVTVQRRSNLNRGSHYVHVTYNLSRYAGKRITLTWLGSENAGLATGFYLDDIKVVLTS